MIFGDYKLEIVSDTEFRLDGGAMFGVIPRVLWEKVAPPDDKNRIKVHTHCLFIETASERILIETGMGEKWNAKQTDIYGVHREKPFAQTLLETTGYAPEQISIVVNTHLHFDHASGNTKFDAIGNVVPNFPNARYFISQSEFNHATNPTMRDKASYMPENWQAIVENGQLELKPNDYEVVKNLTMQTVRGHNATMQTVMLKQGDKTFYSFSDLIPTTNHISPAWLMGYDLYPLETLANKQTLVSQAVKENWLCWFYHDFDKPLCRLIEDNGKIRAVRVEDV